MFFCLFTCAVFFTRRVHAFQDFTCDYTYFRKNKLPVFSCTAILRIFPSLCFCRSSLMSRSRFTNGFFCTCQVSLWVVFANPLKGNFTIFYMLAKYAPGDIKYIFTKFYRHISTNKEANRKFVSLQYLIFRRLLDLN
jgi:hypothetical protein